LDTGCRQQPGRKLSQKKIGLRCQQPDHLRAINLARWTMTTLNSTIQGTGSLPRGRDLVRPIDTHAELDSQRRQRPLARVVGSKKLPPKIIVIRFSHPYNINPRNLRAKNQPVYLLEVRSKLFLLLYFIFF
jgi:hypothetical protein